MANDIISVDSFISFTPKGVQIADAYQVKQTLIQRYKEVYGYDIDVSNTTADGVFINDMTLIINNILQSFKLLYQNLDVSYATGVYLDSLCRLSNVSRKGASQSTANLLVKVIDSAEVDTYELANGTVFIDIEGNEWIDTSATVTLTKDKDAWQSITVRCEEYGPIEAPAGTIISTLEATIVEVKQEEAAALGSYAESDSALRARRAKSNGSQGLTVGESLIGSLLAIPGIDDVQIVNYTSSTSGTADDGTALSPHSMYIIIRRASNITVPDATIGSIIFESITPGINTDEFTGTNGTPGEYSGLVSDKVSGTNTVYWKNATGIAPSFTVTIQKGLNYTDSSSTLIGDAILSYLDSVELGEVPTTSEVIIRASYADSSSQYVVTGVDLTNFGTVNPNTFYDVSKYTYEASTSGSTVTLTFTGAS